MKVENQTIQTDCLDEYKMIKQKKKNYLVEIQNITEIEPENIILPILSSTSLSEANIVVFKPENKQPTAVEEITVVTSSTNSDCVTKSTDGNPSRKHKICFLYE